MDEDYYEDFGYDEGDRNADEAERIFPEPGTAAFTAMCMAEICPQEGDPDFWDRWKDDAKEWA